MVTHVGANTIDIFEREDPTEIKIDLGTNTLVIKRYDPFGFWSMHLEAGSLPAKYQGNFTELKLAKASALKYIAERNEVKEVAPPKQKLKPRMTAEEFEEARG